MIPIKIEKQAYNCPTSWNDITVGQYKRVVSTGDYLEVLSILLEVPIEKIRRFDVNSVAFLTRLFEFMKTMPEERSPQILVQGEMLTPPEDIRTETFEQKILFGSLDGKDLRTYIVDVLLLYLQPLITRGKFDVRIFDRIEARIEKISIADAFPWVHHYTLELKKIHETEKIELEKLPTEQEERADIKMFDRFGVMNTINSLAGGDILKYEQVLKIDYNTVFLRLMMKRSEIIFKENLSKQMRKNAGAK